MMSTISGPEDQEPLFFYRTQGQYGCLSQWFLSKFTLSHSHFAYLFTQTDDAENSKSKSLDAMAQALGSTLSFGTAEQYMMLCKALVFDDIKTASAIMAAADPHTQKKLGRQICNFDEDTWKSVRSEVVKRANVAKFSQNAKAKKTLLGTGNRELIEASKSDRIWGIGFNIEQAPSTPRVRWGLNLLGKALIEAREELRHLDVEQEAA